MNLSEEVEVSKRDLRKAWIRNLLSKLFAIMSQFNKAFLKTE